MSEDNTFFIIVAKAKPFQEAVVEGKQGTKPIAKELSVSKIITFEQLKRFNPNSEAFFMLEWKEMGRLLFEAMQANYKELQP